MDTCTKRMLTEEQRTENTGGTLVTGQPTLEETSMDDHHALICMSVPINF